MTSGFTVPTIAELDGLRVEFLRDPSIAEREFLRLCGSLAWTLSALRAAQGAAETLATLNERQARALRHYTDGPSI